MEIIRYTSVLRKWWWLILLATVLGGGSGYLSNSRTPPMYRASTTIQVGRFLESSDPQIGDITTSQQLARTYAESVRRQPVLQATIDALGLNTGWETLATQVSALAPAGTQLIQIGVVHRDPASAKTIAEEIANQLVLQSPTSQDKEEEQHRQFVGQQLAGLQKNINDAEPQIAELENQIIHENSVVRIRDLQDQAAALRLQVSGWQSTYSRLLDFYKGGRTNYLSIADPATVPTKPIGPNVPLNVLLAASLGFLLAAGSALLIEYLDDTLSTADDVTKVLALPTLGSVMKTGRMPGSNGALIASREPDSPISESYRLIRSCIRFSCGDETPMVLLITSPGLGEGKSTTAANLAVSLAQNGKQVILVDADLRHPSVDSLFGVSNSTGLTSLLLNESFRPLGQEQSELATKEKRKRRRIERYLIASGIKGLRLLVVDQPPQINPVELLASFQMQQVLERLKNMADVVILDCPPVVPLADAATLAAMGASIVLVVEAGRTHSQAARLAKETLLRAHSRILGVVLNKAPGSGSDYYRYYHPKEPINSSPRQRLVQTAEDIMRRAKDALRQILGGRMLNGTSDGAATTWFSRLRPRAPRYEEHLEEQDAGP